ncbi:hypothetical protein D3C72_2208130 [compost metagenome]
MLEVMGDFVGADLQLEDAVATQVEHLLGFGNVSRGVATGQGPGHLQAVAHTPAQQFADRHTETLALSIEQCAFDAGTGKGVAFDHLVQALHGGIDVARVLANQ